MGEPDGRARAAQPPDILRRIVAHKREEIARRRATLAFDEVRRRSARAPARRPFAEALAARITDGGAAVIAEIKKASPSKGLLRGDFRPEALAVAYEGGGAAALSVLTDARFFQGADAHLVAARAACGLGVLRKDFTVDAYQIWEARALGADCVLLIVAALDDPTLHALAAEATEAGVDLLVEVHDAAELERALRLPWPHPGWLLGVNNRDLRTFETRIETTLELLPALPEGILVVTESGIHEPADLARMRRHGVHAFLVGESLVRADDPGGRLAQLLADAAALAGW